MFSPRPDLSKLPKDLERKGKKELDDVGKALPIYEADRDRFNQKISDSAANRQTYPAAHRGYAKLVLAAFVKQMLEEQGKILTQVGKVLFFQYYRQQYQHLFNLLKIHFPLARSGAHAGGGDFSSVKDQMGSIEEFLGIKKGSIEFDQHDLFLRKDDKPFWHRNLAELVDVSKSEHRRDEIVKKIMSYIAPFTSQLKDGMGHQDQKSDVSSKLRETALSGLSLPEVPKRKVDDYGEPRYVGNRFLEYQSKGGGVTPGVLQMDLSDRATLKQFINVLENSFKGLKDYENEYKQLIQLLESVNLADDAAYSELLKEGVFAHNIVQLLRKYNQSQKVDPTPEAEKGKRRNKQDNNDPLFLAMEKGGFSRWMMKEDYEENIFGLAKRSNKYTKHAIPEQSKVRTLAKQVGTIKSHKKIALDTIIEAFATDLARYFMVAPEFLVLLKNQDGVKLLASSRLLEGFGDYQSRVKSAAKQSLKPEQKEVKDGETEKFEEAVIVDDEGKSIANQIQGLGESLAFLLALQDKDSVGGRCANKGTVPLVGTKHGRFAGIDFGKAFGGERIIESMRPDLSVDKPYVNFSIFADTSLSSKLAGVHYLLKFVGHPEYLKIMADHPNLMESFPQHVQERWASIPVNGLALVAESYCNSIQKDPDIIAADKKHFIEMIVNNTGAFYSNASQMLKVLKPRLMLTAGQLDSLHCLDCLSSGFSLKTKSAIPLQYPQLSEEKTAIHWEVTAITASEIELSYVIKEPYTFNEIKQRILDLAPKVISMAAYNSLHEEKGRISMYFPIHDFELLHYKLYSSQNRLPPVDAYHVAHTDTGTIQDLLGIRRQSKEQQVQSPLSELQTETLVEDVTFPHRNPADALSSTKDYDDPSDSVEEENKSDQSGFRH